MSDINDFFGGGAAGSGVWGIAPPADSTEFFDAGNVTANDESTTAQSNGRYGQGWRVPTSDVEDVFALAVGKGETPNSDTPKGIARGANDIGAGAIWGINFRDNFGAGSRALRGQIYYDPTNDNLYVLADSDTSSSANQTAGITELWRIDGSTGATTLISSVASTISDVTNDRSFIGPFPVDPSDPEGPNGWYYYYNDGSGGIPKASKQMFPATVLGAIPAGSGPLQGYQSTTPQSVNIDPWYVTANEDLVIGPWAPVNTDYNYLYGQMYRGGINIIFKIPQEAFDLPYSNAGPWNIGLGFQNPSDDVFLRASRLLLLGENTVYFMADNAGSIPDYVPVYGRRAFDRTDFDRFLHEIADHYNLPPAEVLI